MAATVIGAPDAHDLAMFYQRLLGWRTVKDEGDWVMLRSNDGAVGLSFQTESEYVAPVWPTTDDSQHMMMHLDIGGADLATVVAWAVECGATVAEHQPQTDVRVMLDPVGHPFCLFPMD
ncbi:MAG: VOC family protein [Acidimicrobiia bacterium]|nr:VOC family protein [Acidimicrobiia bacterium]NNF64179.1 VOC family protein [Acidimicrobiia bacterium]